jgi:hypothetical protein
MTNARDIRASLNRFQRDWAPVHSSIAGPVIFAMRRDSELHQLSVETVRHLAFAPWSRDHTLIVGSADDGLAAAVRDPRRDLALRQGHVAMPGGVILLT